MKNNQKEDFLHDFLENEILTLIAANVYDYLQDWMSRKDFLVTPGDRIYNVYGIVDEDLDDLVIAVADANNLILPKDTSYWSTPVVTVEDLIRFIYSFNRKPIR